MPFAAFATRESSSLTQLHGHIHLPAASQKPKKRPAQPGGLK